VTTGEKREEKKGRIPSSYINQPKRFNRRVIEGGKRTLDVFRKRGGGGGESSSANTPSFGGKIVTLGEREGGRRNCCVFLDR